QSPADLETIADLRKIPDLLQGRGYAESDVEKVMHGNWLNFLKKAWS
ncbi:MAG: membrane dipeptidase, partial [Algoriphagus sp.]|nr:membrane dipeptidase [Algoriphagus sp.]